jgi:hypothetical protein
VDIQLPVGWDILFKCYGKLIEIVRVAVSLPVNWLPVRLAVDDTLIYYFGTAA